MAHWPAKAPTEVVERRWAVPVLPDDGLASFTYTASGVTVDATEVQGDDAVFTLSAGSADATATITVTATTSQGRVIVGTFYLPIRASANAFAQTVRDVCKFALRKITGNRREPSASEMSDALERLDAMLASWAGQGADLGVKLPCEAADVLYVADAHIAALKYGLRVAVHEHYGSPIDSFDAHEARRGLQQVKTALLPTDRDNATFY